MEGRWGARSEVTSAATGRDAAASGRQTIAAVGPLQPWQKVQVDGGAGAVELVVASSEQPSGHTTMSMVVTARRVASKAAESSLRILPSIGDIERALPWLRVAKLRARRASFQHRVELAGPRHAGTRIPPSHMVGDVALTVAGVVRHHSNVLLSI